MAPKERAARIWKQRAIDEKTLRSIVAAIREAIAEEREACAKLAEQDAISGDWPPAAQTAEAIRARK